MELRGGMTNKTVIPIVGILFLLGVSAQAKQNQQQVPRQLSVKDTVDKLKVQLELSDKQVDEVKPIIADFLLREEQLKVEEKKELAKVFTPDQMYSWNDLQKQIPKEKKKHAKHDDKNKSPAAPKETIPAPITDNT